MSEERLPPTALWALGATQIIGYGTLYYSFSILAPDMAQDFGWPEQWIFGAFSLALLLAGFAAPLTGKLVDRLGAGRVMAAGSLVSGAVLIAAALSPNGASFLVLLALLEVAATCVFYNTAFVAIVQLGGASAQRSIVHLTLIAGFASTLFWPLTSFLHEAMSWRSVYLIFAALNLCICLPLHLMIAAEGRRQADPSAARTITQPAKSGLAMTPGERRTVFWLMLAGFAFEGLTLSSILVHMVPITQALGMGSAGLVVASLFGPAQVASRLTNMLFGGRLTQSWLAVISSMLLPTGLMVLMLTAPAMPGGVLFALLLGLGSGLNSIVGGTLPLELFGRNGYGTLMGWQTAARQTLAALAPFGLSLAMAHFGVVPALGLAVATGVAALCCFIGIVLVTRRPRSMGNLPQAA